METVREDACIATERLQRDCRKGEQHSLDPVNKLQFRFLSRSENVSLARLLAAALAASREMTVAELDEIKVAVSEAVSNAIIHGYEGRDDCYVEMSLALTPEQLVITVHDDGVGIADIEQAIKPSYSAKRDRMGLGFAFMHSFMDAVDVVSTPGAGTTVTLYKDLP